MTIHELRSKFPNASPSFVKANCDHDSRKIALMESGAGHEPLGTPSPQEENPARFRVIITSIRKRLLDEDNLAEKFHVDCLRRYGFIPNDDPATTRIEVTQRKCARGEPERIEIVIEKK